MVLTIRTSRDPTTRIESGRSASPYTASQFINDGRLVLARVACGPHHDPEFVNGLDGRLVSVDPDSLLAALRARGDSLSVFCESYGEEEGRERLSRFRKVLEYLQSHRSAVLRAGLASKGTPFEVYEEFVDYLLHYEECPRYRPLPDRVLPKFLDEWGHRWL